MPDTGASQSIVSAVTARDANLMIVPTVTELRNASGDRMRLLGEASVVMCNDKHSAFGAAAYQLGNTSSRTITEVKQR